MNRDQAFDNLFSYYNYDLRVIEKKIDQLVEIALTTDNGGIFEDYQDRSELFLFKIILMTALEQAHLVAQKQYDKLLEKYANE